MWDQSYTLCIFEVETLKLNYAGIELNGENLGIPLFLFMSHSILFVGIRSQSRPQDIMAELYKAMSKMDFVSNKRL